jgi:hypothetical protein
MMPFKGLAVRCDWLPGPSNGKGGGRRFESVRGLCKSAGNRRFLVQLDLLGLERAVGMEPFMELFASPQPFVMATPDARSLACDGPSSSRSLTRRTTQILGSVRCFGWRI